MPRTPMPQPPGPPGRLLVTIVALVAILGPVVAIGGAAVAPGVLAIGAVVTAVVKLWRPGDDGQDPTRERLVTTGRPPIGDTDAD